MLKIFSRGNVVQQICRKHIRNIRKYGCDCPKPEYECPHKRKLTSAEIREQRSKSAVHPFLKKDHCKDTTNFWRMIFFGVCVPSMIGAYIIAYYTRPPGKRPPFVPYRHLRIRARAYPWGDGNKSFFHNPRRNALPTGYETEDEDEN